MSNELKPSRGRPSDYSPEIADAICELIIKGYSVRKIGELEPMPCEDTIYTWLSKHSDFSEKYTEAVQHRTNKYLEECVDLSDNMPDGIMFIGLDGRLFERLEVLQLTPKERAEAGLNPIGLTTELINKRKLQIETRMKAAARMHPRKYGEKITQTLEGGDKPISHTVDVSNLPDELVSGVTNLLASLKS
jgi:hypothetical protein